MLIQNDVQFLSVMYIVNNSAMPRYLDESILSWAITDAQNIDLQNCIGTPMYQSIYDKDKAYLSSGTPIQTEYETLLLTYIKPYLANMTIYRALDTVYARTLNTSITLKKDTNMSEVVTKNMVDSERNRYLGLAMFNRDALTRYLMAQSQHGLFPEYTTYNADIDTVLPDKSVGYGKSGIYLNRGGCRKWGYYPGDSVTLNGNASSFERGSFDGDYFR